MEITICDIQLILWAALSWGWLFLCDVFDITNCDIKISICDLEIPKWNIKMPNWHLDHLGGEPINLNDRG